MGKGLSEQQRAIIEELQGSDAPWLDAFMIKIKPRLYPELWYLNRHWRQLESGDVVYGAEYIKPQTNTEKERAAARASISRSLSRLKKRGLIDIKGNRITVNTATTGRR